MIEEFRQIPRKQVRREADARVAGRLAVPAAVINQDRRLIPTQNLEYPGTWVNLPPWLAKMTYRVREDSTVGTTVATLVAGGR